MKYALLIYGAESQWAALSEAEQMAMFEKHGAYSEALAAVGVMVGGEPLDALNRDMLQLGRVARSIDALRYRALGRGLVQTIQES